MSTVRVATLVILSLTFSVIAQASQPMSHDYRAFTKFGNVPKAGGSVDGIITIIPVFVDGEFSVTVDSIVALEYIGERDFIWSGKVGDTNRTPFTLDIPDDTVSAVRFCISRGSQKLYNRWYFDLTGERALIYQSDPKRPYVFPINYEPPPQKVYTHEEIYGKFDGPTFTVVPPPPPQPERPRLPDGYETARIITHIDDTTGLVDFHVAVPDPLDSTWALLKHNRAVVARMPKELFFKYYVPEPPPKSERERKERLERTPLTYADGESISHDDTLFQRSRGESKFKPVAVLSTGEEIGEFAPKPYDSNYLETVVLDLREPDHMDYVRELADSIVATETDGFYKVTAKIRLMKNFRDRGIWGTSLVSWQWDHPRETATPSDSASQNTSAESESDEPPDKSLTLFYDGLRDYVPRRRA